MNSFDTMRQALAEARQANESADHFARSMAEMLIGRLDKVPHHILAKLKKELRGFNIQKREWKP